MSSEAIQELDSNVVVMARVRPFNARELQLVTPDPASSTDDSQQCQLSQSIILMEGRTVRLLDPERNFSEREAFDFDHAFWSIPKEQDPYSNNHIANQEDVYNATGKIGVANALAGYNCCIFAYGQTGSGKTYTMLGPDDDPGISPRLVTELFERISRDEKKSHEQVSVEISFLEIYNEKVKDLLSLDKKNTDTKSSSMNDKGYQECRVRHHPTKGTFVEGLYRMKVQSRDECLEVMERGMVHRATTSTLMNDTSSRSHAIFQIYVTRKAPLLGLTRLSTINLVDLAGSERVKMSGVTGAAFTEATNINLSLTTLRRVIDVLIDNQCKSRKGRPQLPPYRESLLTWVLSDSLGGNSKTMMLATVSPASSNFEDTQNTLRYALKAKAIVCHARVNEERIAAVVHAMKGELEELRKNLAEKVGSDAAEEEQLRAELQSREAEYQAMQEEARKLEELTLQYQKELSDKAEELRRALEQMSQLDGVEEERKKKTQELEEARRLQEETEKRLRSEEYQRKLKEDELKFQLERKESLRRKHDAVAVEEVNARFTTESTKIRSFVAALKNAFLISRQHSDLEILQTEFNKITSKILVMEAEIVHRENEIQQLGNERVYMQKKIESQEKRYKTLTHDFAKIVHVKSEKVAQLLKSRDNSLNELKSVRDECEALQKTLKKLQDDVECEASENREKLASLRISLQEALREKNENETKITQLSEELSFLTSKYETFVSESAEHDKNVQVLRRENQEKTLKLKMLESQHEELMQHVTKVRASVQEKEDELEHVEDVVQHLLEEVNEITRSHEDLKQFVSQRFFPTASSGTQRTSHPANVSTASSGNPIVSRITHHSGRVASRSRTNREDNALNHTVNTHSKGLNPGAISTTAISLNSSHNTKPRNVRVRNDTSK